MKLTKLTRRLNAAFELIREGETVVDVGTDHAYLPIALISSGKCPRAYASDIGKGPLGRAMANVREAGLEDSITPVLTNGAAYFDGLAKEFVIAGMGGELIYRIIYEAPFLKSPDIHLVLQPMTKISYLRRLLCENGFDIRKETLVKEDSKLYTVMSVYYDGVSRQLSEADAITGNINDAIADGNGELMAELIKNSIDKLAVRIAGLKQAGDSGYTDLIITAEELKKRLNILVPQQ